MQRAARFGAWAAAVTILSFGVGPSLPADELTAAAAGATSATARELLYTELANDVAELEQRGSILKRVVKLVTPAVVHIEARRESDANRTGRSESEEAGSGVIIERRGKFYARTSRH